MTDIVTDWIMNILESVNSLGGILIQTPQEFNSTIYNGIMKIQNNVIMPIAYVVLALFLMLELYNITTRINGIGGNSFEIPFRTLFKFVICKTALDSTTLILSAMFQLSQEIIIKTGNTLEYSSGIDMSSVRDVVYNMVDKASFFDVVMASVAIGVINIIIMLVSLVINAIVVGRMIELYVHMGIAPLPLATFPNAEASSIAKNFLKSIMAVSIQGVLIFLCVGIMRILFAQLIHIDTGSIGSMTTSSIQGVLWQCAGYQIVLLIAIFGTGKWAKSICNAM